MFRLYRCCVRPVGEQAHLTFLELDFQFSKDAVQVFTQASNAAEVPGQSGHDKREWNAPSSSIAALLIGSHLHAQLLRVR